MRAVSCAPQVGDRRGGILDATTVTVALGSVVTSSRYSGTCERTMMRGSVISSIANRRPSRPKPDSFDPP